MNADLESRQEQRDFVLKRKDGVSMVSEILKSVSIVIWMGGAIAGIVAGAKVGNVTSYFPGNSDFAVAASIFVWTITFLTGLITYALGEVINYLFIISCLVYQTRKGESGEKPMDVSTSESRSSVQMTERSSSVAYGRSNPEMKYCPKCGKAMGNRDANFCSACGTRIER